MSIKGMIRRWLLNTPVESGKGISIATAADELPTSYRVNVTKALNGHVIQVLTHKSNAYGPDWTGDVLVVPEGGDIIDAIKVGIVSAGLK